MKVIETMHDSRTGETREVSWGNNMKSDLAIIQSVAAIIEHQRNREAGNIHPALERFTTIAIRIEL